MRKTSFLIYYFFLLPFIADAQPSKVFSPGNNISAELSCKPECNEGIWHLSLNYLDATGTEEILPRIELGLVRSDQDFSKDLTLLKVSNPKRIQDEYTALHGKYWYLIHEADLMRTYSGTKLSNKQESARYKLVFPDEGDGRGMGESQPAISMLWESPWRVIMIGGLEDIVESTMVEDELTPSKIS